MFTPQHIATTDQRSPRQRPRRLPAAIGLVFLIAFPAIIIVRVFHATTPHLLKPGDSAPALTARDFGSNEIQRFSFTGPPSALLFFSTDCPHCEREITNFDRLNRAFGDRILFLAISMSSFSKTQEFVATNRPGVRILLDEPKTGSERFGVDVVPTLFLVGPDKSIVYSDSGERTFLARERLLSEFVNSLRSTQN